MSKQYLLLELFHEYTPDEPLRALLEQAVVCHGEIDREDRSVTLELSLPHYVPAADLETASRELCAL